MTPCRRARTAGLWPEAAHAGQGIYDCSLPQFWFAQALDAESLRGRTS